MARSAEIQIGELLRRTGRNIRAAAKTSAERFARKDINQSLL